MKKIFPRFSNLKPGEFIHWGYLAPALMFVGAMTVFPLGHTLWLSFHRYNLTRPWVPYRWIGFDNFTAFFSDPLLVRSVEVTLIFAGMTIVFQLVIGLGAALLLKRKLPGTGIFRILLLTPMMIAPVIAGLIWRLMLNDGYGVVNWVLEGLGFPRILWLGTDWAFRSVVFAELWQWLPFSILLFSVGLANIPSAYYEAASVDGASAGYMFRHITLPNLKRVMVLIVIFKFSDAVKAFDTIYIMTGGGPGIMTQTLALYLQKTGFIHFDMGYAAAISLLLLAGTFAIIRPLLAGMFKKETAVV